MRKNSLIIGGLAWIGIAMQVWSVKASEVQQSPAQSQTSDLAQVLEMPVSEENTTAQMAEVTSVSELADVQSEDWAFQALRSLIERYGVLTGYSDNTFRGNRSLTRYEFAAALNTFLQQVERLIATNRSNYVLRAEDLALLQRLQAEYRSALASLGGRLNQIEARTSELEANVFSPTTQLQGQAILAVTGGSNAQTTVVSRVHLNLLTSFRPNDLLVTQLEAGNNGADAISLAQQQGVNLLGTTGILADGGGLEYGEFSSSLRVSKLSYSFQPQSDLSVTVGTVIMPRDFIDRNRFANNSAVDFSSSFFVNNPLIIQNQIDRPGGAGAAVSWNIGGGPLTLRSLYIATNANNPANNGLFGGQYQGSVELEYQVNQSAAVRLQYSNAVVNQTAIQAGGINAEWALNRKTAIFGRYGFGTYRGFNTVLGSNLDLSPQTWAIGLALRDLGIPGSSAGLAVGQPFITGNLGNATQTNYEAFYNLVLSDNVSITPILTVVDNADNDRANATIWQGTLRTVFSF